MHSLDTSRGAALTRRLIRFGAALVGLAALGAAGCDKGVQREFRAAAVTSLESGVSALIDGLTAGAFAAIDASAADSAPSASPNGG